MPGSRVITVNGHDAIVESATAVDSVRRSCRHPNVPADDGACLALLQTLLHLPARRSASKGGLHGDN